MNNSDTCCKCEYNGNRLLIDLWLNHFKHYTSATQSFLRQTNNACKKTTTYTLAVSTMLWQWSVNVPLGPSEERAPAVANMEAVSKSPMIPLMVSTASLHAWVPTAPAWTAAKIWATYGGIHVHETWTNVQYWVDPCKITCSLYTWWHSLTQKCFFFVLNHWLHVHVYMP